MKKLVVLLCLIFFLVNYSNARKDINAWKKEKGLSEQYNVFKKNLNFWNGSYFMKPEQLDEFYSSMTDTIQWSKRELGASETKVGKLEQNLNAANTQIVQLKDDLARGEKLQNSIVVFGLEIHKNVYTMIMSLIILGLIVVLGIVVVILQRNQKITNRTKAEYSELKDEFESHKKSALDRYTKINMELHKTRLELNKR